MSYSKKFGMQSRKSYIGLLLLTIWAFLGQGVLATAPDTNYAENELHKDNEFSSLVKRPAFFVGSRYGRSSGKPVGGGSGGTGVNGGGGMGTSKTRRLIIVPRNDRFFLGSRYGKRSDEYLSPYEQNSLGLNQRADADRSFDSGLDGNEKSSNGGPRTATFLTMSCVYTGISNFYRCSNPNTDEFNNIMNRSEGMSLDSNSIASEDTNSSIKK